MRATLLFLTTLILLLLAAPRPAMAQETSNGARPNVYFDCEGRDCNDDYYRTEITWVNWVRDPQDSDVHLILTTQTTGAGGREYQLDFIGSGEHSEYSDQIRYQTLPTDTERERLDQVTNVLGIGLARFASEAGFHDIVRLQGVDRRQGFDPQERVVSPEEVDDPWNLWVFRITGNANLDGEETRKTKNLRGSFSASRVTPTWKLDFDGSLNFRRQEIDLSSGDQFTDERTDWSLTQLTVYALADHWSIGLRSEARRLVSFNQAYRLEATPAIEYSFFPYEEATRRSLTAFYQIGPAYRSYLEETVYGEMEELRFEQSLTVSLDQRQTWGDAGIRITGSHFLHDTDLYNVSMRGDISFRITRGFSVNARGDVGWVHDQIYLRKGDATSEEELLNLVRRQQDFNYGIQVGFSFQFGSIYNNVVNNRFRTAGGGGGGDFGGMRGFFF